MHGHSSGRHRRASTAVSGKLALKLGLCLCAGQLIAGPVLASAAEAAPVPVSANAATVNAKVTETVNHRTITYGSAVRVTAKVINPRRCTSDRVVRSATLTSYDDFARAPRSWSG